MRSPRELRAEVPAALERICRTCLSKERPRSVMPRPMTSPGHSGYGLRGPAARRPPGERRPTSRTRTVTRDRHWALERSLKQGLRAQRAPSWDQPRVARGGSPVKHMVAIGTTLAGILILVFLVPIFRGPGKRRTWIARRSKRKSQPEHALCLAEAAGAISPARGCRLADRINNEGASHGRRA